MNLRNNVEIDPDEIFLDASNLPEFNTARLEGKIEKALAKRSIFILGAIFIAIGVFYIFRVWNLQIFQGEALAIVSEKNSLRFVAIMPERGLIVDRNGTVLAYNDGGRKYISSRGFSNMLGFLGFPTEEMLREREIIFEEQVGMDGIEAFYQDHLRGVVGERIEEVDAHGDVVAENIRQAPIRGKDLTLAVDVRIQEALYKQIEAVATARKFRGGAGAIMDVRTGELLALVTYPEYSNSDLREESSPLQISRLILREDTPFLNRVVSGLYTPGSTVKPFMALGALTENVITSEKKILSTGSLRVPNPFDKTKETVFLDWKAHGWVDMEQAIAHSSNVYFYEVGGGFETQRGIGIENINKYMHLFGFGSKVGIDLFGEAAGTIPSPAWKESVFKGEPWLLGDTYHTSIGQYGFQVTPLQMLRAVGGLATSCLVRPRLSKVVQQEVSLCTPLPIPEEYFAPMRSGMRLSVTEGTGNALFVPGLSVSAKTGTAELGTAKEYVNSWVTGYFPSVNPRFSFVLVMERGPRGNPIGASAVARNFFEWMMSETPEYLKAKI